ncbi:hypothetical protein PS619_05753 [Pseudomonas fluorescens]|nr:hypothetical protein PS619_05753 [Pseudomonas fluorescens]
MFWLRGANGRHGGLDCIHVVEHRLGRSGDAAECIGHRQSDRRLCICGRRRHFDEAAIPLRIDPTDPLIQIRMGSRRVGARVTRSEIQMAVFLRARGIDACPQFITANFLQRTGDALRVAGVLHRRSIGEEFTLSTDCRFDHIAKNRPRDTHKQQHKTNQHRYRDELAALQRGFTDLLGAFQDIAAGQPENHDPVDDGNQARVEAHVTVIDMTELMGDHPLQLFTGQHINCALSDADDGVLWRESRREGVDAQIGQQVHRGHGGAGGDGHFFHHVHQSLLFQRLRAVVDHASFEAPRNHFAAF